MLVSEFKEKYLRGATLDLTSLPDNEAEQNEIGQCLAKVIEENDPAIKHFKLCPNPLFTKETMDILKAAWKKNNQITHWICCHENNRQDIKLRGENNEIRGENTQKFLITLIKKNDSTLSYIKVKAKADFSTNGIDKIITALKKNPYITKLVFNTQNATLEQKQIIQNKLLVNKLRKYCNGATLNLEELLITDEGGKILAALIEENDPTITCIKTTNTDQVSPETIKLILKALKKNNYITEFTFSYRNASFKQKICIKTQLMLNEVIKIIMPPYDENISIFKKITDFFSPIIRLITGFQGMIIVPLAKNFS